MHKVYLVFRAMFQLEYLEFCTATRGDADAVLISGLMEQALFSATRLH